MIRRHATPALGVFSAVLACCSFRPFFSSTPMPAIIAAAAASAGIVLLGSLQPVAKRAGVFCLSVAAGFILGCLLLCRIESAERASLPPLLVAEVSGFTGSLTQDSIVSGGSKTLMSVRVIEIESRKKDLRVSAGFDARVVCEGDYRFSRRQVLEFHAALSPLEPRGREGYIAFIQRKDVRTVGFDSPLWAARARLREGIHRSLSLVGYPASALLDALLMGSREDVPADLAEAFKNTGSLHVLALSGLHAGVVFAFVSLLLGFSGNRGVKLLLSTIVLAFYLFLAGPIPSLTRAVLMLVTAGIAALLDRDREPINLLSLAGILILLVDPYQAWSLSFQLSFLALAGILAVGPLLARPLDGRLPPALLTPLCASAAAQLATLPVVASAFGAYYPSGLVASVLLVPLTTAFLWLGLLWLVVSPVLGGALGFIASRAFGVLYAAIFRVAASLSAFPGVAVGGASAPWVAGISAAAFGILCFLPWGGRRRTDRASAALAAS